MTDAWHGTRRGLVLALGLACCGGPRLAAQISPGPLARPHQSLDGALQCVKCHSVGHKAEMTALCLDCHKEIAWLMDRGRGFHARVRDQKCATCHPEHAGRSFALISWPGGDSTRFDHAQAGWPLDGRHTATACADCHSPKFRVAQAAKLSSRRGPPWGWVGLEQGCVTCHADPHHGQLGTSCGDCHVTSSFRTISRAKFNHDRTRYPLRGRHAAVVCERCHEFSGTRVVRDPPFAHCGDCHADAHAGTAAPAGMREDCAACHTVDGWRPATFTVAQHRLTRYPLEGRHQEVECGACHVKNPPGVPRALLGTAGVWMRPAAARCRDCHADDHGGQLAARPGAGACDGCHTVRGWTPSTFTVGAHAALRLPLEGRHAEIPCAACHGPDRKGLAPLPGTQVLGRAGVALRPREIACADCHADPHAGRFPQCRDCHGMKSFRPSTVDIAAHKRYRFPLDGGHAAVPCTDCHKELVHPPAASSLALARWTFAPLTFAAPRPNAGCEACHAGPHGTQFATRRERGACAACHGTDTFRPATRFDHDRDTSFPLKGAHANVACARCHTTSRTADGKSVVMYHGVSGKCEACHGNDVRRRS